MSDRLHNAPTPEGEYFESGRFAGLSVLLGVVAFVAFALCAAGAAIDPKQLSFSWLFAFGFSSRYAPAAFSGSLCITRLTQNGPWLFGGSSKTSPCWWRSWLCFSSRSCFCDTIFMNG